MDYNLQEVIDGYVKTAIPDAKQDEVYALSNSLSHFVIRSITKYAKGRAEHGGPLRDTRRCMTEELENELIDAWQYLDCLKYRLHRVEVK